MINAGIDRVVYDQEYRDTSGLDVLHEGGIEVSRFAGQRDM